jgi:hypothetical protein
MVILGRIGSLVNNSTHSPTIVFATEGTNRTEIIAEMKNISRQIERQKLDRSNLYLIGLNYRNKLAFQMHSSNLKARSSALVLTIITRAIPCW